MQELIVGIIIAISLFFFFRRLNKYRKKFKKTNDACNGCGSSCDGCPIAPTSKRK